MKVAYVLMALAVMALVAVVAWTFRDAGHPQPTALEEQPAEARAASARATPAPRPTQQAVPRQPTAPKPALDCAQGKGDAARSRAGSVSVADLCAEFEQLAGTQAHGDPTVQRAQARRTLDRMIDRQLIAAALSAANRAVTDADVDAAIAQLPATRPQTAPSAAPEEVRRQSDEAAMVRRELRQRLELAKLAAGRGEEDPRPGEIAQEYEQHPERYEQGGGTQVQAYLARVPRGATQEEPAEGHGFTGITLAHNVSSPDLVDALLAEVAAGGGRIVQAGHQGGVGRLQRLLRGSGRGALGSGLESALSARVT